MIWAWTTWARFLYYVSDLFISIKTWLADCYRLRLHAAFKKGKGTKVRIQSSFHLCMAPKVMMLIIFWPVRVKCPRRHLGS